MGTKKLYMKTKKTAAIWADKLLFGKDVDTARASMQLPIPNPENMNSARRPNRSMVKNATKVEMNFQVRVPPAKTRDISLSILRPCWKMTGA